jgi:hypothetical protein
MIVDGLDEWDQSLISKILKALMCFTSHDGLGKSHKLLFSSRDVPQIGRVLSKKSVLCLSDERRAIDAAIAIFVHDNIQELKERVEIVKVGPDLLASLQDKIVEKSEGESLNLHHLWLTIIVRMDDGIDDITLTSQQACFCGYT